MQIKLKDLAEKTGYSITTVSRALADHSRAMRDMTSAAASTAKQIKLISRSNVEQSSAAAGLLTSMNELLHITDRNATGVRQTRGGTDELLRRAQALVTMVDRPAKHRRNGRATRSTR